MEEKKVLDLKLIRTDGGTQVRENLDAKLVVDYAQDMLKGDLFPPMLVAFDGSHYWLSCGFHRLHAMIKNKKKEAEVIVRKGTVRDALLWAMPDNTKHGRRLTNKEKRENVNRMLSDEEWSTWVDRKIAETCSVSHMLVFNMRKERVMAALKAVAPEVTKSTTEPQEKPDAQPQPVADPRIEELQAKIVELEESVTALSEENDGLTDQLASKESMDPEFTTKVIADLREENKLLRIEVKSLTISRDQFQAENAQLMKQVAMLQKKLKKLEPVT